MPDITQIPPSSFEFLSLLKNNNEREWFNEHKTAYQKELVYIESFAQGLLDLMNTHDVIETPSGKKSLYRIYRDTRFSNDKTPYKTHWSGSFKRAGKQRRGGYYFHIEPGNSFVAGGFFGPSPQDLKLIRENISFDAEPLRAILNDKTFISSFEALKGEQLKTAPKGFDGDHQDIDLLRYKQFLLVHRFTDQEVLSKDYLTYCNQEFKNMRPFFDYMSEILTTDANGMDL
ncbi:TIGR02453 family protein [Sphingobacteriaceae bacterium GW460-11-11-14-LB5]|nr:TIGR02453 family protein [Sphingobacteriaceae bacterium GW460-11-11-14-LB5]